MDICARDVTHVVLGLTLKIVNGVERSDSERNSGYNPVELSRFARAYGNSIRGLWRAILVNL